MLWVNKTSIAKQWTWGLNGAVLWVTLSLRERYREKKWKTERKKNPGKAGSLNAAKESRTSPKQIQYICFYLTTVPLIFIQPQKLRCTVKRLILSLVFLFFPKSSFCHLFQLLFVVLISYRICRPAGKRRKASNDVSAGIGIVISISSWSLPLSHQFNLSIDHALAFSLCLLLSLSLGGQMRGCYFTFPPPC